MTHDELLALPEDGGFKTEEITLDGRKCFRPIANPSHAMSFDDHDPLMVRDLDGGSWMLGRINGVLHRRRADFS
jgi:hypothetical protein